MSESRARALIVEDEVTVAAVMRRALLPQWDSDHFVDPDRAVESLDSQRYILAFVDVKLNQHCGFDLIPRLREKDPALRIVIMTGFLDSETRERAEALNVFHFLCKPFKISEIRGLMEGVEALTAV